MSTSLSPSSATPSSAERTSTKDLSLLSQYARSPYGAWTASFLLLAAVPPTVKLSTGYPHLVSLPVFAAIFAGTGYMTQLDTLNGSGTTTAWSLTYLFVNTKRAALSRRIGPISLSSAIAVNAILYGTDYFGRENQSESEAQQ